MQLVICFTYLSPFEAPFEFHEKKSTEPWSHALHGPRFRKRLTDPFIAMGVSIHPINLVESQRLAEEDHAQPPGTTYC